jgi:hypothetical protein
MVASGLHTTSVAHCLNGMAAACVYECNLDMVSGPEREVRGRLVNLFFESVNTVSEKSFLSTLWKLGLLVRPALQVASGRDRSFRFLLGSTLKIPGCGSRYLHLCHQAVSLALHLPHGDVVEHTNDSGSDGCY